METCVLDPTVYHYLCITEDCALNNPNTLCQIPFMYNWWAPKHEKLLKSLFGACTETYQMIDGKVQAEHKRGTQT